MRRTAGTSRVEGFLIDWVAFQPEVTPRLPAECLSDAEVAAELEQLQRNRARDTAREAELILRLAELRPDVDDPGPDTPGARRRSWRKTDPEFAGVSELGRSGPRHRRLLRRRDLVHESVLLVPVASPAEDIRPRLGLPDGPRRHPARHHTVGRHPHHPATRPAKTRTVTGAAAR